MRLCDDRGNVRAEIHADVKQYFTTDQLEGRRAYTGQTYSTAEVLERPRSDYLRREFQVKWLPDAVAELKASLHYDPQSDGRHQNAQKKFLRTVVEPIDLKLRAWATLANEWIVDGHVLEAGHGLAVLFRADSGGWIVRIECVRAKGEPSSPTS